MNFNKLLLSLVAVSLIFTACKKSPEGDVSLNTNQLTKQVSSFKKFPGIRFPGDTLRLKTLRLNLAKFGFTHIKSEDDLVISNAIKLSRTKSRIESTSNAHKIFQNFEIYYNKEFNVVYGAKKKSHKTTADVNTTASLTHWMDSRDCICSGQVTAAIINPVLDDTCETANPDGGVLNWNYTTYFALQDASYYDPWWAGHGTIEVEQPYLLDFLTAMTVMPENWVWPY